MSEDERVEAMHKLTRGSVESVNGQIEELDAEIKEYERRYETPSERLLEELYDGTRLETADIARWLWLLDLRKRVSSHQTE